MAVCQEPRQKELGGLVVCAPAGRPAEGAPRRTEGQIREDTEDEWRQSLFSGVGNMGGLLRGGNLAIDRIALLGIPEAGTGQGCHCG